MPSRMTEEELRQQSLAQQALDTVDALDAQMQSAVDAVATRYQQADVVEQLEALEAVLTPKAFRAVRRRTNKVRRFCGIPEEADIDVEE